MPISPDPARSTPSIGIRIASRADMPAMISMVNTAFVVEDFIEGTRTDELRMSALMKKREFLVAQDGTANFVGSVYVEISGERGYLGMLAVDPKQQGSGVGRRLVQAAEDYCRERGCSYMSLNVLSVRTPVLSFYRKLGYSETGTEEFRSSRSFKAGVDCHAIVMSKQL